MCIYYIVMIISYVPLQATVVSPPAWQIPTRAAEDMAWRTRDPTGWPRWNTYSSRGNDGFRECRASHLSSATWWHCTQRSLPKEHGHVVLQIEQIH